jgi:hypothetical protein
MGLSVNESKAVAKYHLLPYGIWYYGATFDALIGKLESSLRLIFYLPPNVKSELETLSELRAVEGFEDIGEELENWRSYVSSRVILDLESCRKLYEASIRLREVFRDRVNKFLLIKPRLYSLSIEAVRKAVEELPEDPEIREWLQEDNNRLIEFKEGCKALIYGLPTAAGFHFVRLCERALRELYRKETGKDVEKKTWGAILDELEDYYKGKEKPEVLNLISYLKKMRDQIAHPEKFLTQQDAEALYMYTLDIIKKLKVSRREG